MSMLVGWVWDWLLSLLRGGGVLYPSEIRITGLAKRLRPLFEGLLSLSLTPEHGRAAVGEMEPCQNLECRDPCALSPAQEALEISS